ncbi:MAG TPA: FISUMP domain-containing protein [Bacteroidales bacterium]|nr:FISUMP domain-containing protein [Bacteroidales bacterium]
MDSIYIQNLSQPGDTTLYAPNTVLLLDYILGIPDFEETEKSSFSVLPGYPNPSADGTTKFKVRIPEKEFVTLRIVDLLGREVASLENTLEIGTHDFTFLSGREKYNVLTVAFRNEIRSIKILNSDNGGQSQGKLVYNGNSEMLMTLKLHSAINSFGYNLGDQLRFIGYANTIIEGINGSDVIEATPMGNEEFLFDIVQGIPCAGTPNVLYEGRYYNTVKIGEQCWLKENLNIGTKINGSSNQTNNGTIEKYCYYNSVSNCDNYGGLYQWDEMMGYSTTPGVQGICPEGWHLHTDAEWTALTDYVSSQPEYLCNSNTIYIAKALAATTNWNSSSGTCAVGNNLAENNATGFSGLPGGYRVTDNYCQNVGYYGAFWSSAEGSTTGAWLRGLGYGLADVSRYGGNKGYGFSVRCLRD